MMLMMISKVVAASDRRYGCGEQVTPFGASEEIYLGIIFECRDTVGRLSYVEQIKEC